MEKEIRVYGINVEIDDFSEVEVGGWNEMSDEWWMTTAEAQGFVWSLSGFQQAFNYDDIYQGSMYIRFIESQKNS
jgi:hypothetical protein